MELQEKTLLNDEAKNILSSLLAFTETKVPVLVEGLKSISDSEFCVNISEIVKNNFDFLKSEDSQGLEIKVNNKSRIKLN